MKLGTWLAAGVGCLAAVGATVALAGTGDDAPGIGKEIQWINAPVADQMPDLRGRVVFLEFWGIN